jgi:hypothetical protein
MPVPKPRSLQPVYSLALLQLALLMLAVDLMSPL